MLLFLGEIKHCFNTCLDKKRLKCTNLCTLNKTYIYCVSTSNLILHICWQENMLILFITSGSGACQPLVAKISKNKQPQLSVPQPVS